MSVEFELFAGQDRLFEDQTKAEHAIIAGLGAGKTTFGPRWDYKRVVDNCLSPESIIVAPNYRLLKNRCLAEYEQFLIAAGLREGSKGDFTINLSSSDMKITFRPDTHRPGGHTVHLLSGAAPENIVSYNASHIWIDEPALMEEVVVQKTVERLRCPKAFYRQILFTGTPEGLNWFYERFHPNKVPRVEGTKFSESENRLILHGSTYDNTTLPESYLRALEEQYAWDENLKKNYMLGEFADLSRHRFYFAFSERNHVGDYPPRLPERQLYLAFDNNVGRLAWVAAQPLPGVDKGLAVVRANKSDAENVLVACAQIIKTFPAEWKNHRVVVYGDAVLWHRSNVTFTTGFLIIKSALEKHFRNVEIKAPRRNPFISDRSLCTNTFFGQNRLMIDRSCSAVVVSARTAQTDRLGKIKKPKDDDITHPMECVDRLTMALDPVRATFEEDDDN